MLVDEPCFFIVQALLLNCAKAGIFRHAMSRVEGSGNLSEAYNHAKGMIQLCSANFIVLLHSL
jgi:hypothetical protein